LEWSFIWVLFCIGEDWLLAKGEDYGTLGFRRDFIFYRFFVWPFKLR
jgi:hypothetical protein